MKCGLNFVDNLLINRYMLVSFFCLLVAFFSFVCLFSYLFLCLWFGADKEVHSMQGFYHFHVLYTSLQQEIIRYNANS